MYGLYVSIGVALIVLSLFSPLLVSTFKRKPIYTPAMYEIAVELTDNAEQIHVVVDKWEHEKDVHIRQLILEPAMRSLFTVRKMIYGQFEMERAVEKLRLVISA